MCDYCIAAVVLLGVVLAVQVFRWLDYDSARNCMMRAHAETMRSMGYVPPDMRVGWEKAPRAKHSYQEKK